MKVRKVILLLVIIFYFNACNNSECNYDWEIESSDEIIWIKHDHRILKRISENINEIDNEIADKGVFEKDTVINDRQLKVYETDDKLFKYSYSFNRGTITNNFSFFMVNKCEWYCIHIQTSEEIELYKRIYVFENDSLQINLGRRHGISVFIYHLPNKINKYQAEKIFELKI